MVTEQRGQIQANVLAVLFVGKRPDGRLDRILNPPFEKLRDALALDRNGQAGGMIATRFQELVLNVRSRTAVDELTTALTAFPAEIKLGAPAAISALENRTLTSVTAFACHLNQPLKLLCCCIQWVCFETSAQKRRMRMRENRRLLICGPP